MVAERDRLWYGHGIASMIRGDGAPIEVEMSSRLFVDAGGEQRTCTVLRDVTERLEIEHELQRLAQAARHGTDAIISLDLDLRIVHWSPGAERLYGFRPDEVLGLTLQRLDELTAVTEQTIITDRDAIRRVLAGAPPRQVQSSRRRKDGTVIDTLVTLIPWTLDSELIGLTSVTVDITERTRAEQAIARLAAIVESSDDAIIGLTLDGQITSWNAAAERIYGYSATEALGSHITILAAPERQDELKGLIARVARGEHARNLEAIRRRKDGQLIAVSVTGSPIQDQDGRIVAVATTARDITEHKRAEREKERVLADMQQAQRVARMGSWWRDLRTGDATWSAQMYEIFGRDPALGAPTGDSFLAYINPDDRERIATAVADAARGKPESEYDHRIITDDGVQRTVHVAVYADPDRPDSFYGTLQDVTEQREAERERIGLLEASARAESANRAKSEFLGRMSHELRTPLNAIVGFTQLLELEDLTSQQREHIAYVLKAARNLLAMIERVLDLSRIEAGRLTISPEPVALADTVRDTLALIAPEADEHRITLSIDATGLPDDQHVQADRHRLGQVLLNVLSNAIRYNRRGGRVDVRFALTEPGRVRTTIADTGIGIEPDQRATLFEPFETPAAELIASQGTGLGLALSKRLLDAIDGTIEIDSQPGTGTTVTIELAHADRPTDYHAPETRQPDQTKPDSGKSNPPVILYIEDNLSNLTLVERILQRFPGITLIPAMQATIGLELATQHLPDLILLDLHLPDIPGVQVLKRLKAHPPTSKIPVVVLTADTSKAQAEQVKQLGASDHLTKPLDVPRFLEVITRNLLTIARSGKASQ